jgi:aspartyl protease family protein
MKKRTALAIVGLLLAAMQTNVAASSVEVEALLGDTAVLLINGQRKTLRVGEAFAGVTLLAAQPTTATVQVDGRAQVVGLSQRVSTNFQEKQEQVVTIPLDATMQYQTNATINGRSVLVMVDTGANSVALSSQQARTMNIDYSAGIPAQVETASGLTNAYENVPAMVVEGAYPTTILLGMSFLRHVKLQEHNGILSLSRGH